VTSAERTIDPAQPITTHGHTGVCECPTGQGVTGGSAGAPAKAVSVGNQSRRVPHGTLTTGAAFTAFIGIVEGAKKNVAPINMMLTILRRLTCRPPFREINPSHAPRLLALPDKASGSSTAARRSTLPGLSVGGCRGNWPRALRERSILHNR
jgi:hypothetical protein